MKTWEIYPTFLNGKEGNKILEKSFIVQEETDRIIDELSLYFACANCFDDRQWNRELGFLAYLMNMNERNTLNYK